MQPNKIVLVDLKLAAVKKLYMLFSIFKAVQTWDLIHQMSSVKA